MAKEIAYYSKIQECVPKILSLDDECVSEGFFDRKTEDMKVSNLKKNVAKPDKSITDIDCVQRFMKLGLSEETMTKWCKEALDEIDKDPEEDELLIKALKS